ncbi:MAG: plasmid mobilization relaxosome protein MobC [Eubacterium sp.]|nr:plasmid mobilization relaxosome protein MobC [Eubacterium sp.]
MITISKNKTEILTFRATPEEKDLIERKALLTGKLVSEYLRDCAIKKEIVVIDGLKELTTELRRIGNNLNQITKAVNSGIYAVDLTETKKEVQKIWQSLNSLSQAVR